MTISSRAYIDSLDHNTVMDFLRELYAETGGLENWLPTRFENNSRSMDKGIRLWFDDGLVGLVVPESTLLYYVMVHPDYIQLYPEMVSWLEEYSRSTWNGILKIIEMDGETEREKRNYTNGASLVTASQVYSEFVTCPRLYLISSYQKDSV